MNVTPLASMAGTKPDARVVVVARCTGNPVGRHDDYPGIHLESLGIVNARVIDDGRVVAFASPEEFWRWIEVVGRHRPPAMDRKQATTVLLVLGHADRDLSFLGFPEGYTHMRRPLQHLSRRPGLFMAQLRSGRKRIDIMSVGNLHPSGPYSDVLTFNQLYVWMRSYVEMVRANALGVRIKPTLAAQAMASFRQHIHTSPTRPWWHDDDELHAFEWACKAAKPPIRIPATDGFHEQLHYFDFEAFYLSILIDNPMPEEIKVWHPEGCAPEILRHYQRLGGMMLAEVTTRDGERKFLTTPELVAAEVAEVHRLAVYRLGWSLSHWARMMFDLREDKNMFHMKQTIKALGVSLWGRLARRNYEFEPAGYEYAPGDEALVGRGPVLNRATGISELHTEEGYFEADPSRRLPEQFMAIAAHVLAHGRLRMAQAMATVEGEILYAHTDSIWSTTPVRGVFRIGSALRQEGDPRYRVGRTTQRVLRNVEWSGGARYVDGKIDAAPGLQRAGLRRWQPYTDPELAAMPGVAAWEMRQ